VDLCTQNPPLEGAETSTPPLAAANLPQSPRRGQWAAPEGTLGASELSREPGGGAGRARKTEAEKLMELWAGDK